MVFFRMEMLASMSPVFFSSKSNRAASSSSLNMESSTNRSSCLWISAVLRRRSSSFSRSSIAFLMFMIKFVGWKEIWVVHVTFKHQPLFQLRFVGDIQHHSLFNILWKLETGNLVVYVPLQAPPLTSVNLSEPWPKKGWRSRASNSGCLVYRSECATTASLSHSLGTSKRLYELTR